MAVAQAPFWVRQLGFLVGSESNVRHSRPWPAGPVRPSGPCCLAVAQAPFWVRQLGFLVGSESNVRQWGPWPAGPVRPSGPCCFGVASAPCVSLGGWKTGRGGRGPQARSGPSADPCRQQGEHVRGGLTSNKGQKEKIRRRGPQALLFGCGGGAVLGQTAS